MDLGTDGPTQGTSRIFCFHGMMSISVVQYLFNWLQGLLLVGVVHQLATSIDSVVSNTASGVTTQHSGQQYPIALCHQMGR